MKVTSSIWTLFNKEREENECIGEESVGVVSPQFCSELCLSGIYL